MRTPLELLIIMRDNIGKLKILTGMCGILKHLVYTKVITEDEYRLMLKYMADNCPKRIRTLYDRSILESSVNKYIGTYWYEQGNKHHRIRWMNKHIKIEELNQNR